MKGSRSSFSGGGLSFLQGEVQRSISDLPEHGQVSIFCCHKRKHPAEFHPETEKCPFASSAKWISRIISSDHWGNIKGVGNNLGMKILFNSSGIMSLMKVGFLVPGKNFLLLSFASTLVSFLLVARPFLLPPRAAYTETTQPKGIPV